MALLRLRERAISTLLLVLGLGLLVYVGLEYASMFREQRRLAREWEHQQLNPPVPGVPGDTLTRLTIPKIDLDSVVVEGTDRKALRLGPGHMEDTATPGETGNSVITAHRDTFFRHIFELDKGDSIVVQRAGKTYEYEVTGKKIVPPDDMSVVRPSNDARLTLITCYPTYYIGPAPKRLVVFSKLADRAAQDPAPAQVKHAGAGR
jgi:LPXTG-site transpeptidase (sortase) family protein